MGVLVVLLVWVWRRWSHRHHGWRPLHITHLAIDALDDIVINEEVGDDAELRRVQAGRSTEGWGIPQEALHQ